LVDDFRLGLVATTVDAQMGISEIDRFPEALKQITAADLLLVTKSDLARGSAIQTLRKRVAAINPGADILTTVSGDLDPGILIARLDDPARTAASLAYWDHAAPDHHGHDHDHHDTHFHGEAGDI